jgi:tetratricopeptide (TPR) repeat protein
MRSVRSDRPEPRSPERRRSPARALAFAASLAVLAVSSAALAGDLEDGLALKAKGKYEEALAKLEKAAAANPADANAALALSEVLLGLGKFDKAAKAAGAAMDANPDHVGLLVARARALLTNADQMAKDGADSNMILAYVADGDKWIKKALEKDPKSSDARFLRARVLQHQGGGDAPEAIALLEQIVADDPKCFDAHYELGTLAMRAARADNKDKAKWKAAEDRFRAAFAADPKSGQALLQATFCRHWQSATPDLIGEYEKCAELLPGDESPLSQVWKFKKNNPAEVRASLARLGGKEGHGRAKSYVAVLDAEAAVAGGKPDAATKAMLDAVEAWGKGPSKDVYGALNDLAFTGKGLSGDQRDKVWTALWKAFPDRFDAPNNAGLWWRDVGSDAKRSSEWYVRAAELAPNSPGVQNDTGLIFHYNLLDLDKAEPYYRRAIQAAEDLGLDWKKAGDYAKFREETGYRDALNNLAKLLIQKKRWKDLTEFVDDHVPEGYPGRDGWATAGKDGK